MPPIRVRVRVRGLGFGVWGLGLLPRSLEMLHMPVGLHSNPNRRRKTPPGCEITIPGREEGGVEGECESGSGPPDDEESG